MKTNDYDARIHAIEQLLHLFRFERGVYMAVTITSLIVLLVSAFILLLTKEAGSPVLLGLFTSSGGITYTTGRLLRMWTEAIKVIQSPGGE